MYASAGKTDGFDVGAQIPVSCLGLSQVSFVEDAFQTVMHSRLPRLLLWLLDPLGKGWFLLYDHRDLIILLSDLRVPRRYAGGLH